ncbi:universal stress protein [Dictyobacter aurantiacus]|uniref:Universal stress protein UspA n=1 Tax=Dictyobacter aurantiacus TaxID=1936993 RepID=A0A401ZI54_9CHLR|nr:universal stress protein [Dictyobacter aurantiacus]GCE06524.1 universal stress protein UspA [Dictyobacter aurantiacus]
MFQKILVPLDGSQRAKTALPVAARIARSTGASLLLVRIVYPTIEYTRYPRVLATPMELDNQIAEAEIELARSNLRQIAMSDALAGIEVAIQTTMATDIARTLLEIGENAQADLIILCSHGYTGLKRWALGSVAYKLTRSSTIPLLVLHEGDDSRSRIYTTRPQPLEIMVALDGSTLSEAALEPAVQLGVALAVPEPTTLHLVEVLPFPARHGHLTPAHQAIEEAQKRIIAETQCYLEEVKKKLMESSLAYHNLRITTSVLVHEDIAHTLVEAATDPTVQAAHMPGTEKIDLLALTTHGRSGLEHWALGSISERVLDTTRQPLLIVHATVAEQVASS